jgi:protein TonB
LTSIASAQPPKPPAPTIVHISHFDEGGLVARVQPQYPPLAKAARIQGSVVLNAIVGKDGSIQNLQVASGHPMLAEAAVRAVSQWKFRPYILDGSPVEVATQITVHFTLANE